MKQVWFALVAVLVALVCLSLAVVGECRELRHIPPGTPDYEVSGHLNWSFVVPEEGFEWWESYNHVSIGGLSLPHGGIDFSSSDISDDNKYGLEWDLVPIGKVKGLNADFVLYKQNGKKEDWDDSYACVAVGNWTLWSDINILLGDGESPALFFHGFDEEWVKEFVAGVRIEMFDPYKHNHG
jgi:hypothetical protein